METKTRAVVLRMVKYGESKLVVDMFTEEHGRVAFMVSASNSPKGRNKRRLFQPLSLLYIRYDHRLKPGLQTLREASLAYPLSDLPTHPHKLPIAFFLSEFLCHATRDEQQNLPLFHFIAESVTWLDGAREGFANFHVVFMTRLTAFLGFMPNTEDYRPGYVFDLREGAFRGHVPLHPEFLPADESTFLSVLLRLRYENMARLALSRQQRNRCTEALLTYYKLHVPDFPDLKSFSVLRDIAPGLR